MAQMEGDGARENGEMRDGRALVALLGGTFFDFVWEG
jgi:hypothetical protein